MRWIFMMLLFCQSALASYVELSANYWQSRQIYGQSEESSNLSQTYSGAWAWYLWQFTGFEFSAQRQRNLITDNEPSTVSGGDIIVSSRNEVVTDTFSIGIKQSLATSKSRIIPALTLGYAKQIINSSTRYVVDQSGTVSKYTLESKEQNVDSCFLGASLRLRLTEFSGITSSFKSIMANCNTAKFSNNTQVTAGLSWIF
ncbi:MAG: hypothetical protein K2P81_12100 [Bacteriovoracaceae bacterium]|nr:hypothetical protein [Bacteriovoracaceae bacterium]